MTAVPFDTLKLAERLEASGMPAEQARATSLALAEAMSGAELATKGDLRELEQRIVIKLGSLTIIGVGVVLAAMRFLLH